MNKATDKTIFEDMLNRQNFPQGVVKQATREILEIITEGLIKDGAVTISMFGSFRLKTIAERRGINPQTGASITIASHRRVIFTPAKALRELIEPNPLPPILLAPEEGLASTTVRETPRVADANSSVAVSTSFHDQSRERAAKVSLQTQIVAKPVLSVEDGTRRATGEYFDTKSDIRQQDSDRDIDLGVFEYNDRSRKSRKSAWRITVVALLAAVIAILITHHELSSPSMNEWSVNNTQIHMPDLQVGESGSEESESAEQLAISEGESLYFNEQHHHVLHGQSLWQLAKTYYNEPLLWPYIFKANHLTITNPDHINVGAEIIIPSLRGAPNNLSSDDKKVIAESYHLLYSYYSTQNRADAFYAQLMARYYQKSMMSDGMPLASTLK